MESEHRLGRDFQNCTLLYYGPDITLQILGNQADRLMKQIITSWPEWFFLTFLAAVGGTRSTRRFLERYKKNTNI